MPCGDGLGDRRAALLGGGDLDQQVGPVDGLPERLRPRRWCASVSWARPGATSIETRPSTPSVASKTGRMIVAGVADVVGGELEDRPGRRRRRAAASSRDLLVVPLAVGEAPAKIVGLVVTPTTCLSLIELGEVAGLEPLAGQVVEPDGDARVGELLQSVGHGSSWIGGCGVRRRQSVAAAMLSRAAAATALGGDAELVVDPRVVGGGAVVLERDDPAVVADDLAPALRDAGLDRDPGLHGRRDHGLAVGRLLGVEPLPARHRDHAGARCRRRPAARAPATASWTSEPVPTSTTSGSRRRRRAARSRRGARWWCR